MAGKKYKLNFSLYDGSKASVEFEAPEGPPGKTAYQYAVDGGYTGTEEEFAELMANGTGGGGVSSWNDLTDKPTETIGGDTLTWDGNMEGRIVVDMGGYPLVHVSDAVVTAKDVSNGYSMEIVPDGVREFPSDFAQEIADNVLLLNDETFLICCSADNCEVSAIGLVFPKRGVYFLGGEYSIKSLTIPGYTGFKTTTIKTIDEKYMPESVATKEYVNEMLGVIENGTY